MNFGRILEPVKREYAIDRARSYLDLVQVLLVEKTKACQG